MTYDRLFLAVAFVVFLVTFVATMLCVRRQGHDDSIRHCPKDVNSNYAVVKARSKVMPATQFIVLRQPVSTRLTVLNKRNTRSGGRCLVDVRELKKSHERVRYK
jgi:hypothetical protein